MKKLNDTIAKLVDDFLDDEDYYPKFKTIAAEELDIDSNVPDVIKMAMFSTEDGELIFANKQLEDLFFEWQLFKQIADQQPYSLLLAKFPERRPAVVEVAHKMLTGEEIEDDDIIELFEGVEDE